ncbi:MAG: helix-turn-helix domain-containing protein [Chloroflexota bacterium]
MLSERAAEAIAAIIDAPNGLRLRDIAGGMDAPTSSAQRVLDTMLREGLVVRIEDGGPPRWSVAPDVPADALQALAEWRVTKPRADEIRARVASIVGVLPELPDVEGLTEAALDDPAMHDRLARAARHLIWWKPAGDALRQPTRLIAQAMAQGTDEDLATIREAYGDEAMRRVLATAPPGVFSPKAWNYWHLRFGYRRIPPMPVRT